MRLTGLSGVSLAVTGRHAAPPFRCAAYRGERLDVAGGSRVGSLSTARPGQGQNHGWMTGVSASRRDGDARGGTLRIAVCGPLGAPATRGLSEESPSLVDGLGDARHHGDMQVGDDDGHGRYGVLDEDADGLLCHSCGGRFAHLGLHSWKAHGMTAAQYREAHGLGRRGLVVADVREAIAANARERLARNPEFVQRRDPAAATTARLAAGVALSPAGREAVRQARIDRNKRGRLGTVVTCGWCGLQFCPLKGAKRRRFCSRSCASKRTRARRTELETLACEVRLSPRPFPWTS